MGERVGVRGCLEDAVVGIGKDKNGVEDVEQLCSVLGERVGVRGCLLHHSTFVERYFRGHPG